MKLFSKKHFILLVASFIGIAQAFAQDQGGKALTLEECIEYAFQHNANVKNQKIERQVAKAEVNETLGIGLPQIAGSAGLSYNLVTPQIQLPFSFNQETGEMMPGGFSTIPSSPDYGGNLGVTVNQMIFDGSYFVGIKASKVYQKLAQKNEEFTEIEVAEAVSMAYFGALVAEERLELLKNNYQRLDSLFRETKAMYENGFVEAIDVQRIQVNLNNTRTEFENVQRSYGINLNMLKFQMGMPVQSEIQLSQNIEDFNLNDLSLATEPEISERIEYQQLEINRELADLEVRNNKVQFYPRLSAYFNHGYRLGTSQRSDVFDFSNGWFPSGTTVGLNLEVPIFDGLIKVNRVRQATLARKQVDNQLIHLENSINLEIQQAEVNMENSLASLAVQEENMELASEVFRVAKIKYQEGVGSNLEVIEAENAFKAAETNYFNALYNALIAKVSYQKAIGTLYQK